MVDLLQPPWVYVIVIGVVYIFLKDIRAVIFKYVFGAMQDKMETEVSPELDIMIYNEHDGICPKVSEEKTTEIRRTPQGETEHKIKLRYRNEAGDTVEKIVWESQIKVDSATRNGKTYQIHRVVEDDDVIAETNRHLKNKLVAREAEITKLLGGHEMILERNSKSLGRAVKEVNRPAFIPPNRRMGMPGVGGVEESAGE